MKNYLSDPKQDLTGLSEDDKAKLRGEQPWGIDDDDPFRRHTFDGFMHRPFKPALDGWQDALTDCNEYPVVRQARSVLSMANRINDLERRLWKREQELMHLGPIVYGATWKLDKE